MPTLISGASRASTINQNGLVREMLEEALLLDPKKYPFIMLLRKWGAPVPKKRMKVEWRERARRQDALTVTAVTAAAGTDLYVSAAEGDIINPMTDAYLYNTRTGEVVLYQSESAGTVTILHKSGSGGVTFATAVGDKLLILSEGHAEGEDPQGAYSQQEEDRYNYLMEISRTIQATNIEQLEEHYGKDQRELDIAMAWVEEFQKLALVGYFGQRTLDTSSASARRRYLTRGVAEGCQTNYVNMDDMGGGMTYDMFCTLLEKTVRTGSAGDKTVIAGTNFMRNVSAWGENKLQIQNAAAKYGLNIRTVLTWSAGDVDISYDPQLTSPKGLSDRMFVLDQKQMKYLYMRPKKLPEGRTVGGDLRLLRGYDNTSPFVSKDIITGIVGFMMGLEENFLYAYNIR